MRRRLAAAALLAAVSCTVVGEEKAAPMTAEAEVQALKGSEFGPTYQEARLFDHLSCTLKGQGRLFANHRAQADWSEGLALCQGRYVMLLLRKFRAEEYTKTRWLVVDAALLPEVVGIHVDPDRPEGPYLYTTSECTVDPKWGTEFYAVVRLSDRKRMDWRTGVESAWSYDLKRQRIVPLSPKRVICEKPDPD